MEMYDGYGLGSSKPTTFLIIRQNLRTGLILTIQFLTRTIVTDTYDLKPSQVDELLKSGSLVTQDTLFSAVVCPF